jgi:hypothetical protein
VILRFCCTSSSGSLSRLRCPRVVSRLRSRRRLPPAALPRASPAAPDAASRASNRIVRIVLYTGPHTTAFAW